MAARPARGRRVVAAGASILWAGAFGSLALALWRAWPLSVAAAGIACALSTISRDEDRKGRRRTIPG